MLDTPLLAKGVKRKGKDKKEYGIEGVTQGVGKGCKGLCVEGSWLGKDMEVDNRTDKMDWGYKVYPPKKFDS